MIRSTTKVIFLLCLLFIVGYSSCLAAPDNLTPKAPQIDYVEGVVISVLPLDNSTGKKIPGMDSADLIKIRLTSGPESGQEVTSINHKMSTPGMTIEPKPGDKVIVAVAQEFGRTGYHIADFERVSHISYY